MGRQSRLAVAGECVCVVADVTPDAATVASRLKKPKKSGSNWVACCPAHEDSTPSLSISDGDKGIVVHCHAGCSQESVLNAIEALGVFIRKPKMNGNGAHHDEVLTLESLAAAKGIAVTTLTENHVSEGDGVSFRYYSRHGEDTGIKHRKYLGGGHRGKDFRWSRGPKDERPSLYGLWRFDKDYENDGRVILCEGETDALTLWQFGYTALGIPGVDLWKPEWWDEMPASARVYVILEPDAGGTKLEKTFSDPKYRKRVSFIRMPAETKDPNALHLASETFTDDFDHLIESAQPAYQRANRAMDWGRLATIPVPPEREWAVDKWVGMGHVTLLSGSGGTGKTSVAQALSSCLCLRREYLDYIPRARKVLFWACEDDHDELWRRQINIAKGLGVKLDEFDNQLMLHSYDGEEVELAGMADSRLVASPMMAELQEQIGDYDAGLIVLDNIARLYGGNENDRHQVTSFMAMLTKAARLTGAGVLLLGHPSKAIGSEYSGSTAWEGAARARLYLGRDLPGKEPEQNGEREDDGVRYLSRRKANYSTKDWRKITYRDGVMVPDEPRESTNGKTKPGEYAQDTVLRAIRQLHNLGKFGNASTASPEYLPKLAEQYKFLDDLSRSTFQAAMRELEKAMKIKLEVVGKYQNRTPKHGYIICP